MVPQPMQAFVHLNLKAVTFCYLLYIATRINSTSLDSTSSVLPSPLSLFKVHIIWRGYCLVTRRALRGARPPPWWLNEKGGEACVTPRMKGQ